MAIDGRLSDGMASPQIRQRRTNLGFVERKGVFVTCNCLSQVDASSALIENATWSRFIVISTDARCATIFFFFFRVRQSLLRAAGSDKTTLRYTTEHWIRVVSALLPHG